MEAIGFSVQEKKRKLDFQEGGHGGHLGFPSGTILAIFDLQVTPMLPSKFGVNWPFGSGEKRKIDFKDVGHSAHLGFPIGTILATFDLQVTPMLPSKFGVNWPFGSGEEAKNRFSSPIPQIMIFVCLFVLRFYGPVNPMGSCRARSVYLTTRSLGRLSLLSG